MKEVQGIFETLIKKIEEKSLEIINEYKEYYLKRI